MLQYACTLRILRALRASSCACDLRCDAFKPTPPPPSIIPFTLSDSPACLTVCVCFVCSASPAQARAPATYTWRNKETFRSVFSILCFFCVEHSSPQSNTSFTMSTCESAEDVLLKANVEFLDKNYKSALEQYNLAIELDDTVSDAFVKRSLCLEKLKRFSGTKIAK